MKRVLVTHAGGRLGISIVKALHAAPEPIYVIGVDSNVYQLQRANVEERHIVPRANEADYLDVLQAIISHTRADMLWVNHDAEIERVASLGQAIGVRTFMPPHDVVRTFHDKMASYFCFQKAGVPVPKSMPLYSPEDLEVAFELMGTPLWFREVRGAGGKGSLAVTEADTAIKWVDLHRGWGRFMAAEYMGPQSFGWESIWKDGDLMMAQTCKRLYWEFSSLTFSGVTGISGALEWVTDPAIEDVGMRAVWAAGQDPHGIFSVDIICSQDGRPHVTEINAGRFISAGISHNLADGFNAVYLALQLAFNEAPRGASPRINPARQDYVMVHGMDVEPVLVSKREVERQVLLLNERKKTSHRREIKWRKSVL